MYIGIVFSLYMYNIHLARYTLYIIQTLIIWLFFCFYLKCMYGSWFEMMHYTKGSAGVGMHLKRTIGACQWRTIYRQRFTPFWRRYWKLPHGGRSKQKEKWAMAKKQEKCICTCQWSNYWSWYMFLAHLYLQIWALKYCQRLYAVCCVVLCIWCFYYLF